MHITLCGSIAFFQDMLSVQERLEKAGHEVRLPPTTVINNLGVPIPVEEYYALRKMASEDTSWIWATKADAMREHFEKVAWSDAILVLNLARNGVPGYVGSNTFLEMGLAFFFKKRIYLYTEIPLLPCREEILAMAPTILHGDLSLIPARNS